MENDDHRRGSKGDKDRRNSKDEGKGHDHNGRRRSSAQDERRHSEDHNRRHSSDRRNSNDHNRRHSSDRRNSDDHNRRRSSDRRNSDDHNQRHPSDRRRSSERRHSSDRRRSSDRRHSNNEDDMDVEYFGEHNDFFRRLSAIVAYDAEYRRDPEEDGRRKSDAYDGNRKKSGAYDGNRKKSGAYDGNPKKSGAYDGNRKKSDDYDGTRKRTSEDRRDSQRDRRFSGERDRRNSGNDEEHRPSIPNELLQFQQKFQKSQPNGPDHSHFHQRWMFLWPFGKKGKTDTDETAENPAGTSTNPPPNQQQNQNRRKSVSTSEGVQTIDGSLAGPSSMLPRPIPKMISDAIQTSFPNFGLQPNIIRKTKDGGIANPVSFRDDAVQTTETKIKQNIHIIQTSFSNLTNNKKKPQMKDSMTSMHFEKGQLVPPKKNGRTVKAIPRDVNRGPPRAAQNENPEPEVENLESPTSSISQPRQIKKSPSSMLCPICKRGYYHQQVSLSGCLAAFFCLLCCGPCWCRKCCDIHVCDYCGCSKSFYKHGKDGK